MNDHTATVVALMERGAHINAEDLVSSLSGHSKIFCINIHSVYCLDVGNVLDEISF